jgi:hypothetical protein
MSSLPLMLVSNNRERSMPGEEIVIRYNTKTGKLWINGKRCKWSE